MQIHKDQSNTGLAAMEGLGPRTVAPSSKKVGCSGERPLLNTTPLQLLDTRYLERLLVTCFKDHRRCNAGVVGLLPAGDAEAPSVTTLKTGEVEVWRSS